MNAVLDLTAAFTVLLAAPLCLGLARTAAGIATGAGGPPVLAVYWALGRHWRAPALGGRAPAAFRFAAGFGALALAALGEGPAAPVLALIAAVGAGLPARADALAVVAVAAAGAWAAPATAPAALAALALLLLADPQRDAVTAFARPDAEAGGPRAALIQAGAAAALATPAMLAARLTLGAPADAALLLLPFALLAGAFAGLFGAAARRFALAFALAAILGQSL